VCDSFKAGPASLYCFQKLQSSKISHFVVLQKSTLLSGKGAAIIYPQDGNKISPQNIRKCKVCETVHHRTIQINHQPFATIFHFIILTFIYSSTYLGRYPTHHQELNDSSGSLWFYLRIVVTDVLCSWSGRPAGNLLHLVGDLFELSKNIYWITMYHSQP
jgi:hypothetical protein